MSGERIGGSQHERGGAILRLALVAMIAVVAVAGCGGADDVRTTVGSVEGCADVINAAVERTGDQRRITFAHRG